MTGDRLIPIFFLLRQRYHDTFLDAALHNKLNLNESLLRNKKAFICTASHTHFAANIFITFENKLPHIKWTNGSDKSVYFIVMKQPLTCDGISIIPHASASNNNNNSNDAGSNDIPKQIAVILLFTQPNARKRKLFNVTSEVSEKERVRGEIYSFVDFMPTTTSENT